MNSDEIVKAVIELIMLGLEIYFIVWTIKTLKETKDRVTAMRRSMDDLIKDNKQYYREIMTLNQKIKEMEENKNSPE